MEKFTLQHTVLYAKHWYKRYSPDGDRKTIWEDMVALLEMDGYVGTFEGESPAQIKGRVCHLIVGQLGRIQNKPHLTSLQAFYGAVQPYNCWKYGYYTKSFTLLRTKQDIDESPDYDYNEAVLRYCLSCFVELDKENWTPCEPDYSSFSRPDHITDEKILETFGQKLTLKQLQDMQPGVFAEGIVANSPDGIYMINAFPGRRMIWVAKRGAIPDWAIYIHWEDNGREFVLEQGDKVLGKDNIQKLVPCDDEALAMYRK